MEAQAPHAASLNGNLLRQGHPLSGQTLRCLRQVALQLAVRMEVRL